jgi:hypothetical protein
MRLQRRPTHAAILSALLFPFLTEARGNIGCDNIVAGGKSWDLSGLGGPKSVHHTKGDGEGPSWKNVTYTVDICKPLRRSGKVDREKECPHGTRGELLQFLHRLFQARATLKIVLIGGSLRHRTRN